MKKNSLLLLLFFLSQFLGASNLPRHFAIDPNPESSAFRCVNFRYVYSCLGPDCPVVTTTGQVCCRFNVTLSFSCTFTINKNDGTITAYLAVADMDAKDQAFFEKYKTLTAVKITKGNTQEIYGKNYRIREDSYPVLEDANVGKYIQVTLEPVQ